MARCKSSWGALLCVLGIYASTASTADADVLTRAEKALTEANAAKNAAARCETAAKAGLAESTADLDKADFAKAADECRLLKNDGARAEYAAKKIVDRAKAPPAPAPDPQPQPDPGPQPAPPLPPVDPEPAPQPDPVPSDPVPPPDGITIDGVRLLPVSLGSITTPTGSWPVDSLGTVGEGKAYLFRLASRPEWWSVCITRAPDGDGSIDERAYGVQLYGITVQLTVLPGSMKCADNGEPVAPSMERLRQAVSDRRVVPFGSAAFAGWPTSPALKADRSAFNKLGYKPDRIYGRSGSNNAIGIVTGQAGEDASSRGFISGGDAVMIAAALAGNEAVFKDAAEQNRVQTLYGLSLPNLAIWSDANDMLRDPQIPLPGDKPYVNEGTLKGADDYGNEGKWCAPAVNPYLAEIGATAGTCYAHTRDEAHLFNHGFAYWLATGDPRAAILQQAIGAYALASLYTGAYADGRYKARFGSQRATINIWSAAWKLRDIARTASGPLLWPRARAEKMAGDLVGDWKAKIDAMDAATDMHSRASSIFRGIDVGTTATDSAYSWFMMQAYGPEAAYLWAAAGEPAMLRRVAENGVLRWGRIGGALGYLGPNPVPKGFRLFPAGSTTLPYADADSFAAWVNGNASHPTDTFTGAAAHYMLRAYWSLRMAQDAVRRGWMAPVDGLDAAVSAMEAARAKTTAWTSKDQIRWKHAGVPFE